MSELATRTLAHLAVRYEDVAELREALLWAIFVVHRLPLAGIAPLKLEPPMHGDDLPKYLGWVHENRSVGVQ